MFFLFSYQLLRLTLFLVCRNKTTNSQSKLKYKFMQILFKLTTAINGTIRAVEIEKVLMLIGF